MKILIIRLSSLGDIVLTQPVAKILRETFPDAEIDYYTKKQFVDLVKAFGQIDNILVWEKQNAINFRKLLQLRKKYDVVIDLHAKLNTFLIRTIVGAQKNAVYRKKHLLRFLIIKKLTRKKIDSTVSLYFSALKKLGIEKHFDYPQFSYNLNYDSQPLSSHRKYDFHLGNAKKILIFPGALHRTKMYPTTQFAEFIDSVPQNWNCRFIVAGAKNEKNICRQLIFNTKTDIIDLCGKLTLSELISAIEAADVVISNDSGPMHIAAALKKPQISVFGATHPKLGFAPLNKKAIVLKADIPCQPCSLHGAEKCPKNHFRCMKMISPEMLKESLGKLLKEYSKTRT